MNTQPTAVAAGVPDAGDEVGACVQQAAAGWNQGHRFDAATRSRKAIGEFRRSSSAIGTIRPGATGVRDRPLEVQLAVLTTDVGDGVVA